MRSIRAVASAWPSAGGQSDSRTAILVRRRTADRVQTWVLVASAFALGLVLGAVAFVGAWRTTASQGDRANAARALADQHLRDTQERYATLSTQLHSANADLSAALKQKQQLELELRSVGRQAVLSALEVTSSQRRLRALRHEAMAVTSDVAALQGYVTATPSQALDSGFLRTQLAYLSAAARRLQKP